MVHRQLHDLMSSYFQIQNNDRAYRTSSNGTICRLDFEKFLNDADFADSVVAYKKAPKQPAYDHAGSISYEGQLSLWAWF